MGLDDWREAVDIDSVSNLGIPTLFPILSKVLLVLTSSPLKKMPPGVLFVRNCLATNAAFVCPFHVRNCLAANVAFACVFLERNFLATMLTFVCFFSLRNFLATNLTFVNSFPVMN